MTSPFNGAVGGLGSLALAIVATAVAVQSKRDAKRSADAAAEGLEMQREEHAAFMDQRARVPELDISIAKTKATRLVRGDPVVVVQLGITNDGRGTANDALILADTD